MGFFVSLFFLKGETTWLREVSRNSLRKRALASSRARVASSFSTWGRSRECRWKTSAKARRSSSPRVKVRRDPGRRTCESSDFAFVGSSQRRWGNATPSVLRIVSRELLGSAVLQWRCGRRKKKGPKKKKKKKKKKKS